MKISQIDILLLWDVVIKYIELVDLIQVYKKTTKYFVLICLISNIYADTKNLSESVTAQVYEPYQ